MTQHEHTNTLTHIHGEVQIVQNKTVDNCNKMAAGDHGRNKKNMINFFKQYSPHQIGTRSLTHTHSNAAPILYRALTNTHFHTIETTHNLQTFG